MMFQFYAYLHISSHLSELVPTKENKKIQNFLFHDLYTHSPNRTFHSIFNYQNMKFCTLTMLLNIKLTYSRNLQKVKQINNDIFILCNSTATLVVVPDD